MRQKDLERFMRLAIKQAERGKGRTGSNPLVGSVIVKNNRIISKGFHGNFGGPHAEVVALKKAGKKAFKASLFVTLEPCSYYGKTPPCTDIIVKSGIKELICAGKDPNPLNSGKGFKIIRQSGIDVITGVMRKQAEAINTGFFNRMKKRQPLVTLKLAQSLDGKIATCKGDSKWISSLESRKVVQELRKKHDAVLVGINTLLQDDPLLTIRGSRSQPVKIIIDTELKTPLSAKILTDLSPGKTIIACAESSSRKREAALRSKGADIIRVKGSLKMVVLPELMKQLIFKGIGSVLAEGGSQIAASLLENHLVDKLYLFIAPIIIGGKSSINTIGGIGADRIDKAIRLKDIKIKKIKQDILVEAGCLQE